MNSARRHAWVDYAKGIGLLLVLYALGARGVFERISGQYWYKKKLAT